MNGLIIRPGALGDTLMLLPALIDVSKRATVSFVGRRPGLDFVRPWIHRAMDLETRGWHSLFTPMQGWERLPVSGFEAVVAFFTDHDGIIRKNLEILLPQASVRLFRSLPFQGEDIHVAHYVAECLRSAGLPVDPVKSVEAVRSKGLYEKVTPLQRRNRIVFHPGSGSSEKNHPPPFWIDLLTRLSRETESRGLKPVLLLGPAEAPFASHMKEELSPEKGEIYVSPEKEQLLEILNEAAIFVGHDSGITHLSAMLGTPTIALFKKSSPIQWGPLGPTVEVIQGKEAGQELIDRIVEASRHFLDMC